MFCCLGPPLLYISRVFTLLIRLRSLNIWQKTPTSAPSTSVTAGPTGVVFGGLFRIHCLPFFLCHGMRNPIGPGAY